jgi:Raf kinase inhibitor-like YbhB/YbcL family protein
MFIVSPVFGEGGNIPIQHTCKGENISPPLDFGSLPPQTKSLVLMVEDRDASPDPWVHWLVFNIPPATTSVPGGHIPSGGTEGLANGGTHGYEGPCPRYFSGIHHYCFQLFALDTVLDLPLTAAKPEVVSGMAGHIVDSATLSGSCIGEKPE